MMPVRATLSGIMPPHFVRWEAAVVHGSSSATWTGESWTESCLYDYVPPHKHRLELLLLRLICGLGQGGPAHAGWDTADRDKLWGCRINVWGACVHYRYVAALCTKLQ